MELILLIVFVLACWALITARDAARRVDALSGRLIDTHSGTATRLNELFARVKSLELLGPAPRIEKPAPAPRPESTPAVETHEMIIPEVLKVVPAPPPLPAPAEKIVPKPFDPPPAPKPTQASVPAAARPAPKKLVLNWEQFLGVKMFAWLGGLLAFLCVAFFIKLSFERGWISNELRIAISYMTGAAALVGGGWLHRNVRYRVLAQTLCATGILMLYGTTFASHAVYDFISPGTAFAIMACITVGAFLLAVKMNAQVVAVLGMLGGFLTPPLCSTHQDHVIGLFSYVALLDAGLIAVARFRRWHYLLILGALGTVIMQFGWNIQFFVEGGYDLGSKTWLAAGVFGFFAILFAIGTHVAGEDDDPVTFSKASSWVLAVSGILAAFTLNTYPSIVERPELLFTLTAVLLGAVVASSWSCYLNGLPVKIATGAVFFHLVDWLGKSGADHPALLVGYVTMLTISALWLSLHHEWKGLPEVVALGTVAAQAVWLDRHFSHLLNEPSRIAIVMAIALGIAVLHHLISRRTAQVSGFILCASAMIFAFVLLQVPEAIAHPALLYGYVFAINAVVLFVSWNRPDFKMAQPLISGATFVHLAVWTIVYLNPARLPFTLGMYLLFGAAHTAYATLWSRRHPSVTVGVASLMPLITLGLMLLPVFKSSEISLMIWPAFILANLVAMAVAWMNGNLRVVLAGMAITVFGALVWTMKMPVAGTGFSQFVGVAGGLSVVFMSAASVLVRRIIKQKLPATSLPLAALPVSSAVMPFVLLMLAILQLSAPSPTAVFGLALMLVLFLLGTAVVMKEGVLSLVALVCTTAVLIIWHTRHFTAAASIHATAWYAGFTLLFAAFPFVFRKSFQDDIWPWITSAVSGLGTFLLMRDVFMPMHHPGLLPLVYAIPPLFGLWVIVNPQSADTTFRDRQLAWFGGVALLFITLIFPMEFTRQWITFSWALEGAALIWLYTRVPQRGLVYVGLSLLVVVFVRLGLNFQIVESYARGGRLILNWHLAAYGTAIISMLLSARWLRAPLDRIDAVEIRPILYALAGILGFVWINVEITDAFTPVGQSGLVIDFHNANVPRRMTYSIAWGAYALLMIVIGFLKTNRGARYAGIGLMSITILKVFLRDLSTLDNVYRIGALGAVALMALAASFAYQRWFEKTGINK